MENTRLIQINPQDMVAVALEDLQKGEQVQVAGKSYTLRQKIPFGHKLAMQQIKLGENVIKYGAPIGHATEEILPGDWIHNHNLQTNLKGTRTYTYQKTQVQEEAVAGVRDTFEGYVRADGEVGTRNEIWIIPTVSCVNTTVRAIAQAAQEKYGHRCDGIYAFPHNSGCSQLGDDHEITQKLLASIVRHPNAGGVLLVSLGCENNDFEHFLPVLGARNDDRIKCMITQQIQGDEVENGVELVGEIIKTVQNDKRQSVSAGKLKIGFKCGGSDAFSGVTANPLCGKIADRIVSLGGSAVLTEVPEMFGAETILMNRADSNATFEKVVELINSFKQYYMDYNQPIYENPSPGNKAGGITTLEEKSLGCIQKGGQAVVTDTLAYGEKCVTPGLNLMTGPGNDSVSITNLLACGAQVLLFTTGRGNPLGTAMPTIKVASNRSLYERKQEWIDFNAGELLEGRTFSEMQDELWNLVLDTA
ncbi:MAG: altronate dehydratase family protein, partial [Ruthenibacterium sp.]